MTSGASSASSRPTDLRSRPLARLISALTASRRPPRTCPRNGLTGTAAAAAQEPGDVVEHPAIVIAVEGAGQRLGPFRPPGVGRQGAEQHRDGGADGTPGGGGVAAERRAQARDLVAAELAEKIFQW